MAPGPHVFGDGRIGCWFIYHGSAASFTAQLRHRVPRIKNALGMTDAFLPRECTFTDINECRNHDVFVALYETPPHGMSAQQYAQRAIDDINRTKLGVLELNIEGVPDGELASFITHVHALIRVAKPNLRLRINCVPWKAQFLPVLLFQDDPQLYLIIQNFLGNMDARVPEDQIKRDATDRGVPPAKVSIMYGAHISPGGGRPRVPSLPSPIRYSGSLYQDDLITDAVYI